MLPVATRFDSVAVHQLSKENKMNTVSFESLIGEHVLDAVDYGNVQKEEWSGHWEDCQTLAFRLDGKVYVAVEDPSDGYRSMMSEFVESYNTTMKNEFAPCRVLARMKADDYGRNDTLELIDLKTGLVVLEVGTDNYDDYYPCFVANFAPQNMAVNS